MLTSDWLLRVPPQSSVSQDLYFHPQSLIPSLSKYLVKLGLLPRLLGGLPLRPLVDLTGRLPEVVLPVVRSDSSTSLGLLRWCFRLLPLLLGLRQVPEASPTLLCLLFPLQTV